MQLRGKIAIAFSNRERGKLGELGELGKLGELGELGKLGELGELRELGREKGGITNSLFPIPHSPFPNNK
ncbi:MAG: hypothetical protein F6K31_30865 [Symploca sp. SIO2G7]|nr:hypothetical protein [Symploca sp. SIO2G7]